jgi:hypothetical protein
MVTQAVSHTPGSRVLTRDDIIAMGRSAAPWSFLPLICEAVARAPQDPVLRLLAAAHFARVGLRTAAQDMLAGVPAVMADEPDIAGLTEAIARLEPDQIPPERRIATCQSNLRALGDRGQELRPHMEAWAEGLDDRLACRATDGNVVIRRGARWHLLGDERAGARSAIASLPADHAGAPLYIEGLCPPWVVQRALAARAPRPDGYAPPTVILQADPLEALDGLSLVDLSAALARCNVRVVVGEDAAVRLASLVAEKWEYHLSGPTLSLHATRTRLNPTLPYSLARAETEQSARTAECASRVQQLYAGRTPQWWRSRFDQAADGGPPLRVLLPTCRYTTFLQHSARDLARAMEAMGCQTRVVIEPDAGTRLAAGAYQRAIAEFEPDLVVFINYPRVMLGEVFPATLPFVCWAQDAMPHLFDARVGSAQGPLDFLMGYTFPELFSVHRYPRERALSITLAADEHKFHAGEVAPGDRSRFECEIAYASHQSETPDQQHARLREMAASQLGIRHAIDRLRPLVERETSKPLSDLHHTLIRDEVAAELARELGRPAEPRVVDAVYKSYFQACADRLLRHQTLEWAARIARRRGWRFRLYGRGWERHPTLAEFAAGELSHGEDLRASYRCAGVHLHVTGLSAVHQRIMECVLAGGVPMCRFQAAERWTLLTWYHERAVAQGAAPERDWTSPAFPRGAKVFRRDAAPALIEAHRVFAALGLAEAALPSPPGEPDRVIFDYSIVTNGGFDRLPIEEWSGFWAMGERPELFFHDADSLEARIETMLTDRASRDAVRLAALDRVRSHYTYGGIARRMIEFVRRSLASSPSAARTPP